MSANNDGGAAFPRLEPIDRFDDRTGTYRVIHQPVGGMSLRDYFAAQYIAGRTAREPIEDFDGVAEAAYALADSLLTERS